VLVALTDHEQEHVMRFEAHDGLLFVIGQSQWRRLEARMTRPPSLGTVDNAVTSMFSV
jgi:hypothetical protein